MKKQTVFADFIIDLKISVKDAINWISDNGFVVDAMGSPISVRDCFFVIKVRTTHICSLQEAEKMLDAIVKDRNYKVEHIYVDYH